MISTITFFSIGLNLVLIVAAICAARLLKKYIDRFVESHIIRRTSLFDTVPEVSNSIVFLGDSITEGANWAEMFENSRVLNRGIASDTTSGVLSRMSQIVDLAPDKLFIMIGINDLNYNIAETNIHSNFGKIFDEIDKRLPSTKVFLQSVLPVNENWIRKKVNADIPPLNQFLQLQAKERKYRYIDLHALFVDSSAYLDTQYSNDGIHLLGAGYQLWVRQVEELVNV